MNRGTNICCVIAVHACCVEVDVHTSPYGEHTPQHVKNSYSLSSYMSHNYLKLLTLCPYELIKMLNMLISIKFKHGVYQQCIRLQINPLLSKRVKGCCLGSH